MKNFNDLINILGKYAQAQYPFEACGLITKDLNFIPSTNLSNRPRISFMIDPLLLLEHEDNLWAIFHSHPEEQHEEPSEEDLKLLVYKDLKFILSVKDKFYIYWYDSNTKMKRYEIFNENHCSNT